MFGKLHTLFWFVQRPTFWPHMVALIMRKISGSAQFEKFGVEAKAWAAGQAVTAEQALRAIGALAADVQLPAGVSPALLAEAGRRAADSKVEMGGPGDLNLIYRTILLIGACRVLETGVAYGWSSLAALSALKSTGGSLVSVDMPYPKAGNENFVGIVVPEYLRDNWTLIRQPDRNGILRALEIFDGHVDLIHYDSDKSYAGRLWAYPILWKALAPGGIFISDDVQDNFAFLEFCKEHGENFAICEMHGKYVGIFKKNSGAK